MLTGHPPEPPGESGRVAPHLGQIAHESNERYQRHRGGPVEWVELLSHRPETLPRPPAVGQTAEQQWSERQRLTSAQRQQHPGSSVSAVADGVAAAPEIGLAVAAGVAVVLREELA